MTRSLHISKKLSLPLDWITLRTVVYGGSGSGKSTLGAVVAEELARVNQRFCVIDLKGDYWGLRAAADGEREGIPVVIFGGDHADLPLEDGAGEYLGNLVAKLEQPCVLDLEHMSKGKQLRFLGQFFTALYHANREPLLLIADEAQRYAPQGRVMSPDSAICLGAFEDIVKLGRKHGVGVLAITQRGAGLNKDVSELCDMMIAFRTPGSIDQERVSDWLDDKGFEMPMEPNTDKGAKPGAKRPVVVGFENGQALVASSHPEVAGFQTVKMRNRWTFDSSATPRVGQRVKPPKRLAKPEIENLREEMASAIERAQASDPKHLRKRIAELEKQMRGETAPGASARIAELEKQLEKAESAKKKIVEVPVLTDKDIKQFEAACAKMQRALDKHIAELAPYQERLNTATQQILQKMAAAVAQGKTALPPPVRRQAAQAPVRAPRETAGRALQAKHAEEQPDGEKNLGSRARQMLGVLVQRNGVGTTRKQLATLVGLSPNTGTYASYLSRLNTAGYLERRGDKLYATASGVEHAGEVPPLPTGAQLLDEWCSHLGGKAKDMLRALVQQPGGFSREELAQVVGLSPNTGTYASYLSRLNSNELIEKRNGLYVAVDDFFN